MKNILLHILFNDGLEFENIECDTIEEAYEAAKICEHFKPVFHIYTLYTTGVPTGITWKLATDHATNVRENKRKGNEWTNTELETAQNAYALGKSITEIAKSLHRSYNAVYCKLNAQGLIKNKRKYKN